MFMQSLLGQLYCIITRGDMLEADNYVSHHYSLDKKVSLPRAQSGFLLRGGGDGLKIRKFFIWLSQTSFWWRIIA